MKKNFKEIDEYYLCFRRHLICLLSDLKVNKISSLSNDYPNESEEKYLADIINYICFVTDKKVKKGWYLFLYQYFKGYKVIKFDVLDELLTDQLFTRDFSLVSYAANNQAELTIFLEKLLGNKQRVNSNRPFLLRIRCKDIEKSSYKSHGLNSLCNYDNDFIYRVEI